ncbi:unnamed protein product [Paramecium octaurelia]|uniref:Uncharacterized protein n=1 Tax=Paramecium octaurelia TaxID=43137 RepID=A0A8S1TRW3_PAROT|nr:unnamed protein product [Paramecium octaurelia]
MLIGNTQEYSKQEETQVLRLPQFQVMTSNIISAIFQVLIQEQENMSNNEDEHVQVVETFNNNVRFTIYGEPFIFLQIMIIIKSRKNLKF